METARQKENIQEHSTYLKAYLDKLDSQERLHTVKNFADLKIAVRDDLLDVTVPGYTYTWGSRDLRDSIFFKFTYEDGGVFRSNSSGVKKLLERQLIGTVPIKAFGKQGVKIFLRNKTTRQLRRILSQAEFKPVAHALTPCIRRDSALVSLTNNGEIYFEGIITNIFRVN